MTDLVLLAAGDVDAISISFNESSLTLLKIVIGTILFGIALDTRLEDFRAAARKPVAMAVAIAGQFLLLPAITFGLTLLLNVRGSVALGMILVACCPPGNVSNILTHRARGDVALSVAMTSVGNVLAIFLMPLNFAFWGGLHPTGQSFLADIEVSPWDMLSEVLLVIGLPFVLGITIARLWPRVAARAHGIVSKVAFVALGAIILVGISSNWDVFVDYIGAVLPDLAVVLSTDGPDGTARTSLLMGPRPGRSGRLPPTAERQVRRSGHGGQPAKQRRGSSSRRHRRHPSTLVFPRFGGVVLLDSVLPNREEQHGRRGYPPEFRGKVLDPVEAGRPIAEVAKALGISAQSIYTWRRQDRIDKGLLPGLSSQEQDELVAARRRITQLEIELAVTRRAAELLKEQAPPFDGSRPSR